MKPEDLNRLLEKARETKILNLVDLGEENLDDNLQVVAQTIPNIEGLVVLEVVYTPIVSKSMAQLAPAIRQCHSLRHVAMSWCEINHVGAKILFDALKDHPGLLSLELMDNKFIDGEDPADTFEGILALVELLKNNYKLLFVDLFGNKLGLSAGGLIEEALQQNNTMLSMKFYQSLFGEEDLDNIVEKLRKNRQQFIQAVVVNGKLELAPSIPIELVSYLQDLRSRLSAPRKIELGNNPILFIADLQTRKPEAVLQPVTENDENKKNALLFFSGQTPKKAKVGGVSDSNNREQKTSFEAII